MSSPVDAPDSPGDGPDSTAGGSDPSPHGPNSPTDGSDSPVNTPACAPDEQGRGGDFEFDDVGLEDASGQLRVERRRVSDERAAFRAFADRLLDADAPLRAATIEAHYRGIVMAVPHYRQEYGDSFERSVASEFGSTIAFDCRCERRLDEAAIDGIRAAARRSWRRRDELVDRIDAERHAVETAVEGLADLRDQLEALSADASESRPSAAGSTKASTASASAVRLRLSALRERCDALARRRLATLRTGSPVDGDEDHALQPGALQSLCYHDLDTDRPVLAAIDELRCAIERRRRRVLDRQSTGR